MIGPFAWAHRGPLAGALAVTLLEAMVRVSWPLLLKFATDAAIHRDGQTLSVVCAIFGGSLGGLGLAHRVRIVWLQALAERSAFFIDQQLMRLAMRAPTVEHLEDDRFRRDLDLLRLERESLASIVPSLADAGLLAMEMAGAIFLLFGLHPLLACLPLLAIPVVLFSYHGLGVEQQAEQQTIGLARTAMRIFQLASSPSAGKEIRVFGLGNSIVDDYDRYSLERERMLTSAARRGAMLQAFGWCIFALGYCAMMAFVVLVLAFARPPVSGGDVLMACSVALSFGPKVGMSVGIVRRAQMTALTLQRYLRIERIVEEQTKPLSQLLPPALLQRGIRLEGATFRYPGTEDTVLRDINLDIPAGSVLAIVGGNGAGKSTLIKLICGLYTPTAGEIFVDGIKLSELDISAWRARTAAVFQDAAMFEFTARETVGVGDLSRISDRSQITKAVERASATETINALRDGLDTELGITSRRGAELSTGQWQRLSIARGLMRDAPLVLVLDEPTASLDAHTEHSVLERYAAAATELGAGGITILVSHRLSTVRMADLILVLDRGRVVQLGNHSELIQRPGLYANLYGLQARSFAPTAPAPTASTA